MYKSIFKKNKLKEETEEEKAKKSIEEIIKTDWGKSNESQGKISQIFKALSFNDSTLANSFMDDVNKLTTSLKDKYLSQEKK